MVLMSLTLRASLKLLQISMDKKLKEIIEHCNEVKDLIAKNDHAALESRMLTIHTALEALGDLSETEIQENKVALIELERNLNVISTSITALKKLNTDALKTMTNSNLTYE